MTSFRERMSQSAERHQSRVVLALDVWGPYGKRLAAARSVLEATRDRIAAVKVNHHLLLPLGLTGIKDIVGMCKREGLPLIADLKINDIESTNLNIVGSLLDFGFDALTANPFVGWREGLEKVMEEVHAKDGGVLLLVYMSHQGAEDGYGLGLGGGESMFRVFSQRAKDWGADGIVVSAKSAEKIREARRIVGEGCMIFSPGVGAQGGSPEEWYRTDADYMIVGRAVMDAQDPREAVISLAERREIG